MRATAMRNEPTPMPEPIDSIVEVRGLCKTYGDVEALRGIDLDFPRGKLTSLLGPSGCGKTTLLKIIAGLIKADAGTVAVNGKRVSAPGPERAFVFQDFALMPWATVIRNVAFGLELRGTGKAEREDIARHYIAEVGLAGFEDKYPHELSGGMRQRVGLARALSVDADVLLLDEPFSAVDEQNRRKFQEDLIRLRTNQNKTFIFVTHSIEEAVYISDRIVLLSPRPGRISQIIEPEIDRSGDPERIHRDKHYLDTVDEIWQRVEAVCGVIGNDPVWLPRADDGLAARLVCRVGDRRSAGSDLPAAALQRGSGRRRRSRADAVLAKRDDNNAARLRHRHGPVDRGRHTAWHPHGPVKIADDLLGMWVNIFSSAPLSAIVPVLMILFGFGEKTIVAAVFLFAIWIIVLDTRAGVRHISPSLIEMARSYGASRRALYAKIILWAALPEILAGIRLGLIRGVKGVVIGQLLVAIVGYGALFETFSRNFRMAEFWALTIILFAFALLIAELIERAEAKVEYYAGARQ